MSQGAWVDAAYREHCQAVFRVCLRLGAGDRPCASDRTHDVFLRALERREQAQAVENLGGWLYVVAVNTCYMALRRERLFGRIARLIGRAGHDAPRGPEREVRACRSVQALGRALRSLPPKQRVIVALVYFEGKSQTEAAALLRLSKGQVSKLHNRALATLGEREWDLGDE